jgi:hypothetical protein
MSDGDANLNGDADHSAGCDGKSSGNKSSTDESVDVFSDSISTDYEFLKPFSIAAVMMTTHFQIVISLITALSLNN